MPNPSRKIHGIGRGALACVLLLAVIIICFRMYLPTLVKNYVNKILSRMPDYQGKVDEIDIALYRGAYRINGLKLLKKTASVPEPFIASPAIDLSVQWKALFNGSLVGEIEMERPILNFVNGPREAEQQTGIKKEWTNVVADLFPFKINRFAIRNGTVTYRHEGGEDKVALQLSDLTAEASNLSNAQHAEGVLPSSVSVSAKAQKIAPLEATVKLDPFSKEPRFVSKVTLTKLPVASLNTLLNKTLGVDAERGELSIFSEAKSSKGGFSGYVKPIAKDVSLISLEKDSKNPLALVWESAVAALLQVFTNQRHDQFATEIPFEGKWEKPEASVIPAVWQVLVNAFWEALPAKLNSASDNSSQAQAGT